MEKTSLKNQIRKRPKPCISNQELSKSDEGKVFEIMFLSTNQDQSVEVYEGNYINFGDVVEHIRQGYSVFITHKKCPTSDISVTYAGQRAKEKRKAVSR